MENLDNQKPETTDRQPRSFGSTKAADQARPHKMPPSKRLPADRHPPSASGGGSPQKRSSPEKNSAVGRRACAPGAGRPHPIDRRKHQTTGARRQPPPVGRRPRPAAEKPLQEEKAAASVKKTEETEEQFDPRFHLDRHKSSQETQNYAYNGHRVSTSQDLHYTPPEAPQYDELRSSYTALDSTEALFPDSSDGPKKKIRIPAFLQRSREKEARQKSLGDIKKSSAGHEMGQNPQDNGRKHGVKLPNLRKKNGISDEDHGQIPDRDTDDIPSSFGTYLASRIAGIMLRLRGNVPAETTSETMPDREEDLGPELAPMAASKYYGSQIYSMRLRTRLAFLLLILMTYLSLGLPVPGMLQDLRVATAACLALQLTIMLLALDITVNAFSNAFCGMFGADTLAVLSCLITTLDAVAVLGAESVYKHIPFCAVSSFSLFGIMLSSLLSARGIRKSLRVPAIGKKVYAVTSELNVTGKDVTLLKSTRTLTGFVRRMEEAPIDEELFRRFSPLLFLLSVILAVFAAVVRRSIPNILYILSAILSPAVPFTALLAFALPFFVGSHRIFGSGAALAGWSGISDIGYSKNLIVTDRDLFPAENIEIDNVRIFADYDAKKVISYAGSIVSASKSGLVLSFQKLMEENNCPAVRIDNFEVLAGGGLKGMAEGHTVICGSHDLMRLMNVRIPYRLLTDTSVLLSIDGVLYGIFNMKYTADPKVRKALVSLMRSNRHPIFAIRDFNVTPEFIHECFDVATDGYDFPPYTERFPISDATPSEDSQIAAVVCREGLGPLTDLADTGRSIFVVSRLNTALTGAAAVLGLLISFFRFLFSGTAGVGSSLLLMLLFALPVLILGLFTTSVN